MDKQKLETKAANLKSIIDYCLKTGTEPKKGHVEAKKEELRRVENRLDEMERQSNS